MAGGGEEADAGGGGALHAGGGELPLGEGEGADAGGGGGPGLGGGGEPLEGDCGGPWKALTCTATYQYLSLHIITSSSAREETGVVH